MANFTDKMILSFNRLVYEYLVKCKYEKSAMAFKMECQLDDVRMNEAPPTLLSWYSIFIETADVRSGRVYVPDGLNRIEGIMLKLENEKQRYARMSSVNPSYWKSAGGYYEHEGQYSPVLCPQPPGPAAQSAAQGLLKEYKRIELNLPFIFIARFCPASKILLCCCVDGKVYFYNLSKNIIECSAPLQRRPARQLACVETHEGILFAYSVDDYTLFLCRYANGKKEDVQTIELELAMRSFCLGSSLFVLSENSVLRIFSLSGEPLRTIKLPPAVLSIEIFSGSPLLVEATRVIEYDLSVGTEIKTLAKGKHPIVCVKDDLAFVICNDSIQAFNQKSPFPALTLKASIDCRDIAMVLGRVAVCTGNEIFYGNDVISVQNSIGVFSFSLQGASGLMIVASDGLLLLLVGNSHEYA